MTIKFIAMIAVVAIVSTVAVGIGSHIRGQNERLEFQAEQLGELRMANAWQDETITELRESKERDDSLVADTAEKLDKLATRIQSLDRRTQEALRNAPNLTVDSLLPPAAADAFCLQWHEASGRLIPDHPGNASGGVDARAGDTASAGRGTPAGLAEAAPPDCSDWRKMTVRDAVEWNGLLLRHAGLEREDIREAPPAVLLRERPIPLPPIVEDGGA